MTLQEQFGQIDIYLFDQILRGNISPGMRVVDAGCGGGRNIQYLVREGYEVFGVDVSAEAVAAVRKMASEITGLPAENFQVAGVEAMPFEPVGGRRFWMSHGAEWLLVDEALLMELTRGVDGELVDPLKTTVVQGGRCMTTWVMKKKAPGVEGRAFVSSGMPARGL